MGDDMKFVVAALVVAVAAWLTPAVAQTAATKVAAKSQTYEQCYKRCTDRGGKPRSCGTQCQTKS
jgi:hypothetical protein